MSQDTSINPHQNLKRNVRISVYERAWCGWAADHCSWHVKCVQVKQRESGPTAPLWGTFLVHDYLAALDAVLSLVSYCAYELFAPRLMMVPWLADASHMALSCSVIEMQLWSASRALMPNRRDTRRGHSLDMKRRREWAIAYHGVRNIEELLGGDIR